MNSPMHSRQVSAQAVRRLRRVPVQAGWRYLDVGCGNGAATVHVARSLGLSAIGIDIDPEQIALARRAATGRADAEFVRASALRLPFAPASFHVAGMSKALHHILEWRLALDELCRVVTPGGYLAFADLIVPAVLHSLLRRVFTHHAGGFTATDLDGAFASLKPMRRSRHWLHYEALFIKP